MSASLEQPGRDVGQWYDGRVPGWKLAVAYYLVPSAMLVANLLLFVPSELRLPPGDRSGARLSVPLAASERCVRWEGVQGAAAAPSGGRLKIEIRLQNCGKRPWPDDAWGGPVDHWGAHAVRLGARWSSIGSRAFAPRLDWRASLPHPVLPGSHLDTTVYVPAPKAPGRYALEIDLVQELVAWFSDTGTKPLRLGIEVR